jgi:hypothetical protein
MAAPHLTPRSRWPQRFFSLPLLRHIRHDLSHRRGVFLDTAHEGELRAAAVEVVAGALDAEIGVALEVVGEEAQAGLVREELAGEAEVRALGYPEQFLRLWDYYLCYCEGGYAERQLGNIQVLLTKPGCRRPAIAAA